MLPTFIAAPHVSHATYRVRALRANPDVAGTRMARIAVRPAWVGLLDFETRMPSALGGTR